MNITKVCSCGGMHILSGSNQWIADSVSQSDCDSHTKE